VIILSPLRELFSSARWKKCEHHRTLPARDDVDIFIRSTQGANSEKRIPLASLHSLCPSPHYQEYLSQLFLAGVMKMDEWWWGSGQLLLRKKQAESKK
jgi:hypothetical protein